MTCRTGPAAARSSLRRPSSRSREALKPEALKRLRHALALVIGPEAILAARDVCGLSAAETRKVTRWAAEAIVAHALSGAATLRQK